MKRARNQNRITRRLSRGSINRVEVLLFLCLWLGYGAAINSDNLVKFNLQQIGVEALVERHQFYLEGSSVPQLQPGGDVFVFRGHKFAAKQPGQTMVGAIVYWVLHAFGLSYANNYLLSSALVTFFTTSLVVAASGVAILRISRRLTKDPQTLLWPLLATCAYALGTTIFAYSGIAHHDALATAYLVLAFYFIFDLPRAGWDAGGEFARAAGAGLLLGLAVTTSMLVLFMAFLCALYFLCLRRWKLMPFFCAALVMGLVPLLIYDARCFGNPFLVPNVAGAHVFADTFFRFSANNFAEKVAWYATMLAAYSPVILAGLFGLSYFPRELKRKPFFAALIGMALVLLVYITNIRTIGDCQFGPRYLMPLMPFLCLGVAGYSYLSRKSERCFVGVLIVAVGLLSFGINLLGAIGGAMNCPDGSSAVGDQWLRLVRGDFNHFPLAPWLLGPLAICLALLVWSLFPTRQLSTNRPAVILH